VKIALDKQAHFLSGAVIVFALYTAGFGPLVYMSVCLLAGALKEIYDHRHKDIHTPDVWDAFATTLGGLAAQVWILLSVMFFK